MTENNTTIRNPVVAGQFYPASPASLRVLLKDMADAPAEKEDAIGVVCPHAGYIYSGKVAGAVFSRIKIPDTVIIIGPNHTGGGEPFSIMAGGSWRTPLGDVPVDAGLAARLIKGSPYLKDDLAAHAFEHSVEVQLPFLQFFRPDFKFVPIILSYAVIEVYKDIGHTIARAVKALGREVLIVASSDMTHYEPQASARRKDAAAIEAILALDADGLLERIADMNISMCGYAPVVAMMTAARELGADTAELVKYQTSGDASGDTKSVVGYAGIIVKNGGD